MKSIRFDLWMPRYWLIWLGIGVMRLFVYLPLRVQLWCGKWLGRLAYYMVARRRRIAEINIALCFPDLDNLARQDLCRAHFEAVGMGIIELFNAWWASEKSLQKWGKIEGLGHLEAALGRGKGVILFTAHFTALEMGTRFLTSHAPIHGVYRPHSNKLIDYLFRQAREKYAEKVISRESVRDILRSLHKNKCVWLATDQNFGHKGSIFAEFFKQLAATNTAVVRFAELSGAALIPFFVQRTPAGFYAIKLLPELDNFPSKDLLADITRLNHLIEQEIMLAPEQYFWMHRRFKDRPDGGRLY